jgi:hypothetical protein
MPHALMAAGQARSSHSTAGSATDTRSTRWFHCSTSASYRGSHGHAVAQPRCRPAPSRRGYLSATVAESDLSTSMILDASDAPRINASEDGLTLVPDVDYATRTLADGRELPLRLDVFTHTDRRSRPLVLYVSGGGFAATASEVGISGQCRASGVSNSFSTRWPGTVTMGSTTSLPFCVASPACSTKGWGRTPTHHPSERAGTNSP